MKILIDDGMQIQVGTGIGKYSLYLYEELKKQLKGSDSVALAQFDKSGMSKKQGRLKYIQYMNSSEFYKTCCNYDVVHFTNYALPFRRSKNTKYVVTVHDLASFLHPESLPTMYRYYNRFVIQYAIRHADIILTVSNSVKQEILHRWPKYEAKVKVAYPGLYEEFKKDNTSENDSYKLDILNKLQSKKFFLFVGTIETRKNLGIVIKSFLNLKQTGRAKDFKLVLAGRPGFGYEEYDKLIKNSRFADDIITTGYIATEDCKKLYREAAAYIFPSIYEGFGSTQLECMANHLPIILSDIPTNIEVSRDYGLFFHLDSEEELQQQMEKIMEGKYDTVSKNAVADDLCARFQWNHLIENYLEAYKS